ncbi:MAG: hypothetical protein WCS69_12775 [Ignavibacteriaceae bacterium]|jgi:predicted DNA-binding antitoxin AbrB/MazE fold protein
METIKATYHDGLLFPIDTLDLKDLKEKVIKVKIVEKENISPAMKKRNLKKLFNELHQSNPFSGIQDPVAWQKKVRVDRALSD